MSKRLLVKVAKELNVGTSTIIEHLQNNGFEVENKPTANISDEMYDELMKEFKSSVVIKEQAEKLVIGHHTRPEQHEKEPERTSHAMPSMKTAEPAVPKTPGMKPPVEQPVVEKAKVDDNMIPKLKVLGKIDLDKPKPKAKEVEKQEPQEEPVQEPQATVEEPPAPVKAPEPEPEATDDIIRHEAPQLKGLKILGKIDTNKFNKPKKKKEKEKEKPKAKEETPARKSPDAVPGPAPVASSDDTRKKRKRKRKTVSTMEVEDDSRGGARGGTGGKGKKEDFKKASTREIDDKVRSTMAKMSGGGKSKRQKIRRESRERKGERQEMMEMEGISGKLQVTEFISVSELANIMNVAVTDVIMTCMNLGVIVSINQRLDAELIELIADEFGHEVEFISLEEQETEEEEEQDAPEDLEPRAPIVTVMGHVDHGKTSLLDYIRSANVVSGEAGGITQHIGAYEVVVNEKKITFLDTPGHEAFTAMRARGAKVTDIAVIIVAADDNVMPQTKEAISHAQAAGVPIIFAINKIDKPGANPDKIKQELASMNLLIEEWGGKYQSQDISAKTGENIDLLLEKILLEAELQDLKANPNRMALGTVLEASLDKGRGYVTKCLVQNGSLHIGDIFLAGEFSGRVKAMFNERGKRVKDAGPSTPVLVLGLSGAPQAGEKFKVMAEEQEARSLASKRSQIIREQTERASKRISLDEIGRRLALGTFKELNLIVKGDVDGSVEALSDSLIKLSIETVQVNVIHKAVGQIIESDVLLASASDAIIIGFQVRPSLGARKLAEKEGVQIKTYSIIYEAIEEVKLAIEGLLEPTEEEKILGQLEVRDIFKISKVGTIAGCFVQEGKVNRNNHIRIIRDGIVIYPTRENVMGEISSLKRFKEDVKEVKSGMECGVTVKNFNDIKVGDIIEVYEIERVKQTYE
ncbi:MAG: translation initiation factor IF-2 [Lewinellaceae bacterium]|nr:translation initiation factor IF-2 [Lewinellaceae bacterium]